MHSWERIFFFLTFLAYTNFCEFWVFSKNRDCGEILLFGNVYPSLIYFTMIFLAHASGVISTSLNVHGTYSQGLD